MILRADWFKFLTNPACLYVLGAIAAIVVLYVVFSTIRGKRCKHKNNE